ncbi:MAG: site-specific integrase [Pseudonocardia sp.]|nr:site-specific integrase [Pseudonocardia sp.]
MSKRCPCPPRLSASGKRLACQRDHGSWFYIVDLGRDPQTRRRRQEKRGGFRTRDEATAAMNAAVKAINDGTHARDDGKTVGEWLDEWLGDKVAHGLRPTTERSYRQHIRDHLRPQLGDLRLRELRPNHVQAMLRTVTLPRPVEPGQKARPAPGPVTVRRVHATLRAALATAYKRQLVALNAAAHVDLPKVTRAKVRPWDPAELGRFLDSLGGERLGALFETIAGTGLRRGEACGLRWSDVDLGRGVLVVRQQLVQAKTDQRCPSCGTVHKGHTFGPPKTASGEDRVVELDGGTAGALLAWRLRQDEERAEWAAAYVDHGLVFCRENGNPLDLAAVTKRFGELCDVAGVRRVRLHDLRHGAASLLLAAGADMALVSKRLGHSSISITADTYSHLLEGVGRAAAERAAALVPRTRSRDQIGDQPGDHEMPRDQSVTNPPGSAGSSRSRRE